MADESGYAFRAATRADSEWLAVLHQAAYATLCGYYSERERAWQEGFFSARIGHPVEIEIVSWDGRDVGAVYLGGRDGAVVIESLEVTPERQGRGAGSAALGWVLSRAERNGQTVVLNVHKENFGARRLYERCGFSVVGTTATHDVMSWPHPEASSLPCTLR